MRFPVSRSIPRLLLPANAKIPDKCNSQKEFFDRRS